MQDELDLGWMDYGARMYDGSVARFFSLDPKAEQFHFMSPYVYAANDPIRYIDYNGEDPREGNTVVKINFNNSAVTRLKGYNDSGYITNKTVDKSLYKRAQDRFAHVTLIGPKGRGPDMQKKVFGANKRFKILGGDFSAENIAYTFVSASQSQEGYEYYEFSDDNTIVERKVDNLTESLGVEGFENVVSEKNTVEYDEDGNQTVLKQEFWSYTVKENEDGRKEVYYEYFSIDLTKSRNEGGFYRSGLIKAEPNKNDPEDEQ